MLADDMNWQENPGANTRPSAPTSGIKRFSLSSKNAHPKGGFPGNSRVRAGVAELEPIMGQRVGPVQTCTMDKKESMRGRSGE